MATRAEAASRLGVDIRTVSRMIKDAELKAEKNSAGEWVIDDQHLAAKEAALLDDVHDRSPVAAAALDARQAELMAAQSELQKATNRTIELLQKPLETLTTAMQNLLNRALDREEKLQAQVVKGWETVQLALDRTQERDRELAADKAKEQRLGDIFDFVKDQLPVALKYGALQKALPKVAPFVVGMFQTPEDVEQARQNLPPETFEGLQEVLRFCQAELAAQAAKEAQIAREGGAQ